MDVTHVPAVQQRRNTAIDHTTRECSSARVCRNTVVKTYSFYHGIRSLTSDDIWTKTRRKAFAGGREAEAFFSTHQSDLPSTSQTLIAATIVLWGGAPSCLHVLSIHCRKANHSLFQHFVATFYIKSYYSTLHRSTSIVRARIINMCYTMCRTATSFCELSRAVVPPPGAQSSLSSAGF